MTLLITFFLVAILFSFLCSLWEAVLLSLTPAYAEIQNQQGSELGRLLQSFKSDIDRPLAAILTLNTIAHTVGAIGVGDQASTIWAETNPWVTKLVIPVTMTLAILILSEIIPKTVGATYWKALAPFTVRSLQIIVTALAPLVWLSQHITVLLKPKDVASSISRSGFVAMAKIGQQEGVLEKAESDMITNLLRFETVRAQDIMTPRTVVVALADDASIQEYYESEPELRFSRIPVYQGSIDHIIGYVLKDELFASLVEKEGARLVGELKRDILRVDQQLPLPELFSRFVSKREHIALVMDEFGGMAGVVTMEDAIETLLGLEIVDEFDQVDDMQAHARAQWERRARAYGLLDEPDGDPAGDRPKPRT